MNKISGEKKMQNNLSTVEKNLRSIAKRYENVKYSVGLAVLFLMKGTSAFSDDNKIQEIEKQKDILTDAKKAEVKETMKKEKASKKLLYKSLEANCIVAQEAFNFLYNIVGVSKMPLILLK